MTARRPVIGMSAAVERVQSGAWNEVDVLLPLAYSQAVQRAGGLALLLPPDEAAVSAPDEVLDLAHRAAGPHPGAAGGDAGDQAVHDQVDARRALTHAEPRPLVVAWK